MEELQQLTKTLMQHTVLCYSSDKHHKSWWVFFTFLQLQRFYVYHNHSNLGVIQSQTRCDWIMWKDVHDYSSCGFALEYYVTMTYDGSSTVTAPDLNCAYTVEQ